MSLSAILNNANTGLTAAQAQLRVVSDNVANVNTPGYVRKIADQQSLSNQGMGAGVEVARIRLATDRFLQAAGLNAGAEAGRQGARAELFDRIQSLFGDPGGDAGFFARIDGAFAGFAATAEDAVSSPLRRDALFKTEALFDEAARVSGQIQATRQDADGRIHTAVERANGLLDQIDKLNVEISRSAAIDADSSGARSIQARLISELGTLLDVRVTTQSNGGVSIRTGGGALLAGPGAATLEYQRAGTVGAQTVFNDIWITEPGSQKRSLNALITTGEIKGLLELRDVDAPETAERLAELLSHVADELNRAHNANTAVPAPRTLTGRNVGQTLEAAVSGFSGQTVIAITRPDGSIQRRVQIEFSDTTITVNGVATTANDFLATLNTALGPDGAANFIDGRLRLTAVGVNGVVVADPGLNEVVVPPAAPTPLSDKNGRGFSHFFGLNDLITADRPTVYETGLKNESSHGFAASGTVKFRFSDPDGGKLRDLTFTVPAAAGRVDQLVGALNDPVTGVGRFGSFSLNASGTLTFTGKGTPPARLDAFEDTTSQAPSGTALTELFGIGGGTRAARADGFSLRPDIAQDAGRLALAQLNLDSALAAGRPALVSGDGRGAVGLADAGNRSTTFQAAGDARGGTQTVSRYAAEMSGAVGGKATALQNRADAASAVRAEADARQTAFEGVNLDEELVLMTTYQQAFNASARLIQAARDLYDVLLGMV